MNKKVKLLHITTSLKIGGAEAVLCDIIDKLGNNDFEHHVIYFYAGPYVDTLRDLGVTLYQVSGLMYLYDPLFFIRLFFCVKKIHPDVIHSLLWMANISSRLISLMLRIPHVSVYHNNIDQDGKCRNILDTCTRRLSKKIIAVSPQVVNSIGDTKAHIEVIYNGIDIAHVYTCAKRDYVIKEDLGISKDTIVIGSVGRLVKIKNFPLLLKSFALLKKNISQIHLVIVGQGSAEYLKKIAYDLGIIDYVTFVIGKRAYGYYPLFDFFVQCSDKEGVSIALLEAMSFSLVPIVASISDMHPVITHEENGIIFDASDAKALEQACKKVIVQTDLQQRLARSAKASVVQTFSAHRMADKYRCIFLSMANSKL